MRTVEMAPTTEAWDDAKLKALIGHLVRVFPNAAVLSRQVADRYHVFIIMPYDGSTEKAIQVDRALFLDRDVAVEEFASLLCSVDLPSVLQRCDRYYLSHASWPQEMARISHVASPH
jgi:hypothetical protein